ncbi:LysR family transcriptional regulator [Roseomonas sp. BN140053]|uniref:LysR family transcriptional regulator n=1 Tax=Roseomonas sp. BN140053 TaxID=3391898 RepID=UPI0039EB3DA7
MDSRRLRYFVEIIDQGSLSGAAASLHISQAALSKAVRLLEAELSVTLLHRLAHGISPTPFGAALYTHARAVGSEILQAQAEIARLRDETHSRIALGVLLDLGSGLVPRAVAKFCAQRPEVQVRVTEDVTLELLTRLRRGEVDFVIGLGMGLENEIALKRQFLFDDSVSVIVARDHPLLECSEITATDLLRFPWVVMARGSSHRARLEQFFQSMGAETPRPQIECASVQFAKSVIRHGCHLAVLPLHAVEAEIESGSLRALPVHSTVLVRRIVLMFLEQRPPSAAGRALVQEIRRVWRSSAAAAAARH